MATTDAELLPQLRIQTGYSERVLDDPELEAVMDVARRHIRTRKSIEQEWTEDDWYENEYREEALFWFSCLFAKVATGELDAQNLQIGAVDAKSLLAKEGKDVTTWFRNAEKALNSVEPGSNARGGFGFGLSAPIREDRVYGDEDTTSGTGVSSDDLS